MGRKIKMRKAGGSVSATIPRDLAERYRIEPGDEMTAIPTAEGILLTPYDKDFTEAMAAYEQIAKKYRNAFRELAK